MDVLFCLARLIKCPEHIHANILAYSHATVSLNLFATKDPSHIAPHCKRGHPHKGEGAEDHLHASSRMRRNGFGAVPATSPPLSEPVPCPASKLKQAATTHLSASLQRPSIDLGVEVRAVVRKQVAHAIKCEMRLT